MRNPKPTELGIRAVNELPRQVQIGPFTFELLRLDPGAVAGRAVFGECSVSEQEIRMQHHMPSPAKAADTLLHEILHAMYWAAGVLDEDKEERIIGALSTGMVQLHRDNPWLAPWLSKWTKETKLWRD